MKTRKQILQEIKRQKSEIEQYFRDIAHWNDNHPGYRIDPDPDGLIRKILRNLNGALNG